MHLSLLVSSFILLAGVVDDLRSRKIHNQLVLVLAGISILSSVLIGGWPMLQQGLWAALAAFGLCLPLVMMKALGGGDLKLLVAFGFSSQWTSIFWILVYAMVWGLLLGLIKSVLDGQLKAVLKNTLQLASGILRKAPAPTTNSLHHIPFSVALFFGWLTYLTLMQTKGQLL